MEAKAYARFQRYGARKVNQVLAQIRGKSIEAAEQILPAVPRAASAVVAKTIKSAAANLNVRAGKKLAPGAVIVTQAWAGHGPMGPLKRVLPAPMGRAMTFKRKVCHITIVVSDGR